MSRSTVIAYCNDHQRHMVLDTAKQMGRCAVVNSVAVFVGDKEAAIRVFRRCMQQRMDRDFEVLGGTDDRGEQVIGVDMNQCTGVYLYGVEDNEFKLHVADLAGRMQ